MTQIEPVLQVKSNQIIIPQDNYIQIHYQLHDQDIYLANSLACMWVNKWLKKKMQGSRQHDQPHQQIPHTAMIQSTQIYISYVTQNTPDEKNSTLAKQNTHHMHLTTRMIHYNRLHLRKDKTTFTMLFRIQPICGSLQSKPIIIH